MTAPMESLAKIVELASEVGRQAAELERLALAAIIEQRQRTRETWTRTGVSGCVSPPLELAPDVACEPDTSSTAHDPERVAFVERCGE